MNDYIPVIVVIVMVVIAVGMVDATLIHFANSAGLGVYLVFILVVAIAELNVA